MDKHEANILKSSGILKQLLVKFARKPRFDKFILKT